MNLVMLCVSGVHFGNFLAQAPVDFQQLQARHLHERHMNRIRLERQIGRLEVLQDQTGARDALFHRFEHFGKAGERTGICVIPFDLEALSFRAGKAGIDFFGYDILERPDESHKRRRGGDHRNLDGFGLRRTSESQCARHGCRYKDFWRFDVHFHSLPNLIC